MLNLISHQLKFSVLLIIYCFSLNLLQNEHVNNIQLETKGTEEDENEDNK